MALLYTELAVFGLTTLTTTRRWLRHREAASGWLAATFGLLAGFIGLAQLLPPPPFTGGLLWLVKAFLVALFLFPYCLYRFMATFGRPQRSVEAVSYLLVASVIALTAAIPAFPQPGQPRGVEIAVYTVLIVTEWVWLSGVVVLRLWRAGAGLPTVARRRSQMLAAGAAVLALNVVVSVATPAHTAASVTNVALQGVTLFSALLFLFGFRPPRVLLARWRRGDDEKLREAMVNLVQATSSADVVGRLLPRIAELVGARGTALLGADGTVLGSSGVVDPGEMGSPQLSVDLPEGALHIWSSPYTPFFNRDQLDLLHSLGSLLHLALDRTLAQELAGRAATDLAEAQALARMGSWRWEPGTGVVEWSPQMYRLYGVDPATPVVPLGGASTHPDDEQRVSATIRAAVADGTELDSEWRIVTGDGEVRWMHVRGRLDRDPSGGVLAMRGTSQDITERHELQSLLAEQALHDDLTGLPNRRLFVTRLTEALAEAEACGESVAVLFIDVDRFKLINDGLGHEAGDELLVTLGQRLSGALRPGDTVARFGGDEFVLLCHHQNGQEDAEAVTHRVQRVVTEPVVLRGVEMVVTLSIGVALSGLSGRDPGALLRDADAAMYQAKHNGRATHAIFAEDMRARALRRLDTERELRKALLVEQLDVHYQPIYDLRTGALDSVEALVRWQHPTRGLIGPDEFIGVAEETGLIVPLGELVLEKACHQLRLWQLSAPELAGLRLAVNLSGVQVALPDLTQRIGRILRRTGIAGAALELEITESVLMHDAEETMTVLGSLKSLGVRLSVDDFGTGYSSLSYLKRFPVDTLKVDRSFVDGLGVESEDSAIVQSVLALAAALGMDTVAEGVETARQLSALGALGCDKAQGYYLSRPLPAEGIGRLLGRTGAVGVPAPRAARQSIGAG